MMKLASFMAFAAVLGMILSSTAYAGKDRVAARSTQYKCYLTMQDGTELVNYMMSKENYANGLTKALGGGYIYAKDGVSKRAIRIAHECVLAGDNFRSNQAQALDVKTLH